ncbi:VOC family protein [Dawidia cretensis]|uniref:VOC family protein n=1 Tax=Dawidia cretensis TaxID=2782350 RepID=UPI0020B2F796|nr:VOC family protein [Dawidia cretensis]
MKQKTNVITWFDIPVTDPIRAKTFYETILDIKMMTRNDDENEGIFFPHDPKVVQPTSERVTGVLSKSDKNSPSGHGTVVYINASLNLQTVLDRVERSGGKVLTGKIAIPGLLRRSWTWRDIRLGFMRRCIPVNANSGDVSVLD